MSPTSDDVLYAPLGAPSDPGIPGAEAPMVRSPDVSAIQAVGRASRDPIPVADANYANLASEKLASLGSAVMNRRLSASAGISEQESVSGEGEPLVLADADYVRANQMEVAAECSRVAVLQPELDRARIGLEQTQQRWATEYKTVRRYEKALRAFFSPAMYVMPKEGIHEHAFEFADRHLGTRTVQRINGGICGYPTKYAIDYRFSVQSDMPPLTMLWYGDEFDSRADSQITRALDALNGIIFGQSHEALAQACRSYQLMFAVDRAMHENGIVTQSVRQEFSRFILGEIRGKTNVSDLTLCQIAYDTMLERRDHYEAKDREAQKDHARPTWVYV